MITKTVHHRRCIGLRDHGESMHSPCGGTPPGGLPSPEGYSSLSGAACAALFSRGVKNSRTPAQLRLAAT